MWERGVKKSRSYGMCLNLKDYQCFFFFFLSNGQDIQPMNSMGYLVNFWIYISIYKHAYIANNEEGRCAHLNKHVACIRIKYP